MNTLLWSAAALALVLLVVAPILDRVVFPEPAPGPEFHPPTGAVFHSDSEGFTQRILARKNGMFWLELTMRPYAPGPPPHVHTTFPERFRVERGVAGIVVLGSAYGSSIADIRLCTAHDRFVSPQDACCAFDSKHTAR